MSKNTKFFLISFIIFIAVLGLDQFTKVWAYDNLQGQAAIVLIPDIFEFSYLEGGNTGGPWGLFSGKIPLFVIVTVLIVLGLISVYLRISKELSEEEAVKTRKKFRTLQIILVFLTAGAIGNLIDRVVRGYVVDFLYFKMIDFPVFNVADCYVTLSVITLFIFILFVIKDEELNKLFSFKKKETENTDTVNRDSK